MKMSGAPLDRPDGTEAMVPDFAADPDGGLTPLDAHIRLANPRTPGAEASLMLRRPFNYVNGVLKNGQLDQGLLFIAFQADLEGVIERYRDKSLREIQLGPILQEMMQISVKHNIRLPASLMMMGKAWRNPDSLITLVTDFDRSIPHDIISVWP